MARRARPKALGTRYDQREIGIRVEKLRNKRGLERKAVFDVLGIAKGEYSRKERGLVPFTLWEISKVADLLSAPPGWPFVTEEEGERLRAVAPAPGASPSLSPDEMHPASARLPALGVAEEVATHNTGAGSRAKRPRKKQ